MATTHQQPNGGGGASLVSAADFQNVTSQYSVLDLKSSSVCTSCNHCGLKFKYSIEHLFHFIVRPDCLKYVMATRDPNDQQQMAFYPALFRHMANLTGLALEGPITCDTCQVSIKGPMLYCIHRDQHRPSLGDLFACQFCGLMYRTPHGFYRHSCIRNWDPKSVVSAFKTLQAKKAAGGAAKTNDTFKIYANLTEEEKSAILRCPICKKEFAYLSGLIVHLKSSFDCLVRVSEASKTNALRAADAANSSNNANIALNLVPLVVSGQNLAVRAVECEICGCRSNNQVGYAVHRDHHALKEQGTLICKGCNSEYRAPCEFYRHICANNQPSLANGTSGPPQPRLMWCAFCEISRNCDTYKPPSPAPPLSVSLPSHPVAPAGVKAVNGANGGPHILAVHSLAPSPSVVPDFKATEDGIIKQLLSSGPLSLEATKDVPITSPPLQVQAQAKGQQSQDAIVNAMKRVHEEAAKSKLKDDPGMRSSNGKTNGVLPANFDLVYEAKSKTNGTGNPPKAKKTKSKAATAVKRPAGAAVPSPQPVVVPATATATPTGPVPVMVAKKSRPPPPPTPISTPVPLATPASTPPIPPPSISSLITPTPKPASAGPPKTHKSQVAKKSTNSLRAWRMAKAKGTPPNSGAGRVRRLQPPPTYLCRDCEPHKLLRGARAMSAHCEEMKETRGEPHYDIEPLSAYSGLRIVLKDARKDPGVSHLLAEEGEVEQVESAKSSYQESERYTKQTSSPSSSHLPTNQDRVQQRRPAETGPESNNAAAVTATKSAAVASGDESAATSERSSGEESGSPSSSADHPYLHEMGNGNGLSAPDVVLMRQDHPGEAITSANNFANKLKNNNYSLASEVAQL